MTYIGRNFAQPRPGTRLFPGDDTPQRFEGCNLTNCTPPPGSSLIDCNTTQVERQVADGEEEIEVDQRIIKITRYVDRILGKYNPDSEKVDIREYTVLVDPPEGTQAARIKHLARNRDASVLETQEHEAELSREVAR